jgi:CHAT domain-containing protein
LRPLPLLVFIISSLLLPATEGVDLLRQYGKQIESATRSGNPREVIRLSRLGIGEAKRQSDPLLELSFRNNLAFGLTTVYRMAEGLAEWNTVANAEHVAGSDAMRLSAQLNIAMTMLSLNQNDHADSIRSKVMAAPGYPFGPERAPRVLLACGWIYARQGHWNEARPLLDRAVALFLEANRKADAAHAREYEAHEFLLQGRHSEAKKALAESIRLGGLLPFTAHRIHRMQGQLATAEGRFEEAHRYFEQAQTASRRLGNIFYNYLIPRDEANLLLRQNKPEEALSRLRSALDWSRRLRLRSLPVEALRMSLEEKLNDELHSVFIETACARARATGNAQLALEAFAIAEESRRTAMLQGNSRAAKHPEYQDTLIDLQRQEAELMKAPAEALRQRVEETRQKLELLELELGIESIASPHGQPTFATVREAQAQLRLAPDETFIRFYAGPEQVWVWAIGNGVVEWRAAGNTSSLGASVDQFRQLLQTNDRRFSNYSAALYQRLLGGFSAQLLRARHLVIAPDQALHQLPFAALRTPGGWLLESSAVRTHSGAAAARAEPKTTRRQHYFVALGDATYNRADPRLQNTSLRPRSSNRGPMLGRLSGSRVEIQQTESLWRRKGATTQIAIGADVNRENLRRLYATRPTTLHLAAHVLPAASLQGRMMLALRYDQENGTPELLGEEEIASLEGSAVLVVMSGCRTAGGRTFDGAGIASLTRAWMLAGARRVLASHWPVIDDQGSFFTRFYQLLPDAVSDDRATALALQQTQIQLLRAGGPSSLPGYWAAYLLYTRG